MVFPQWRKRYLSGCDFDWRDFLGGLDSVQEDGPMRKRFCKLACRAVCHQPIAAMAATHPKNLECLFNGGHLSRRMLAEGGFCFYEWSRVSGGCGEGRCEILNVELESPPQL